AAEQLVCGVVDVLRVGVIRPEINSASEAVDEIGRPSVICAATDRWERCHAAQETVCREREWIVVVKALKRARRAYHCCRHVAGVDVRRKRRDAATGESRVKRGR